MKKTRFFVSKTPAFSAFIAINENGTYWMVNSVAEKNNFTCRLYDGEEDLLNVVMRSPQKDKNGTVVSFNRECDYAFEQAVGLTNIENPRILFCGITIDGQPHNGHFFLDMTEVQPSEKNEHFVRVTAMDKTYLFNKEGHVYYTLEDKAEFRKRHIAFVPKGGNRVSHSTDYEIVSHIAQFIGPNVKQHFGNIGLEKMVAVLKEYKELHEA